MYDAGMTNVALHTLYLQAKIPEHDGNREASAQDGVKKITHDLLRLFRRVDHLALALVSLVKRLDQ